MSGDSTIRREESSIIQSSITGSSITGSSITGSSITGSSITESNQGEGGKEKTGHDSSPPSGSRSGGKESPLVASDWTLIGRPSDQSVESKSCHSNRTQGTSETERGTSETERGTSNIERGTKKGTSETKKGTSFWNDETGSIRGPGRAVMKLSRTSSQPVRNVSSASSDRNVSSASSDRNVSSVSSAMNNSHRRNNSSTYEGFKSATDEDWDPDLVLDTLSISNPGAYTGISRPSGQKQSPSGQEQSQSPSEQKQSLSGQKQSQSLSGQSDSNQKDPSPSDPNPQPLPGRIVIGPGHPHPPSILPPSFVSSAHSLSAKTSSSANPSSGQGQSKSASSQAQRFISSGESKPGGKSDERRNDRTGSGKEDRTGNGKEDRTTEGKGETGVDPKVRKLRRLILEDELPDMNEVRSLAWSGIPCEVRPTAWKLLLGYIPLVRSKRTQVLERKRSEYYHLVHSYYNNKSTNDDMWRQIHIDIPRMQPLISIFQQEVVQKIFERILYIWSIRHPASGYVQGMNDLVTPFFVTYLSEFIPGHSLSHVQSFQVSSLPDTILRGVEADSFWSFTKLLDSIQDNYTFAQPGIQRLVNLLSRVMSRVDVNLHDHLMRNSVQYLQFSFRWMNNLLIRELPLRCIVRLWDTYLAEGAAVSSSVSANHWSSSSSSCVNSKDEGNETSSLSGSVESGRIVVNDSWSSSGHGTPFSSSFHLFVCAAFLRFWSKSLLKEQDFQGLMLLLQNLPTFHWTENEIKLMVADAYQLKCTFTPSHLNS